MNIKKIVVGTAAGALMLGALAIPAFAASTPPTVLDSAPNVCWDHGTFQALQGNPAIFDGGLTVSQDAIEDGGMGAETGPANSASCQ